MVMHQGPLPVDGVFDVVLLSALVEPAPVAVATATDAMEVADLGVLAVAVPVTNAPQPLAGCETVNEVRLNKQRNVVETWPIDGVILTDWLK